VPVIALSYAPRPAARPGFLFIELTPDLRANLSLIKRLQPEVRQVRLVVGPLSAAQRAAFEAVCAQFTADLDWAIWPEEAALEARLAALGPDAAVVWAANGCGGGNDFTNFKRLTGRLKAPVYGLWDTYLGAGLVGGVVLPTRAAGRAVAAMLPAILSGSAVAAPRLEPELVVDGRALERYGLKRSGLPAGARFSARVNPGEHILTPWLLLAALAGWLITLLWDGLLRA
jgi:hypothetical protein